MFSLFKFLIVLFISILLLVVWLITQKKIYIKILSYFYLFLALMIAIAWIVNAFTKPINLKKEDYYGEYIIKKDFFKGKQADWQYNHYRFEIKRNDSIYFYITENEKILKTLRGKISTVKPFNSERLVIKMDSSKFHILEDNPTIFRNPKGFYLVFRSSKYYNVFFEKGKWTSLNK
ncbi:hypothetical protein EDM00_05435 [Ornithobacterium rhinotracheale]|uniref:hypothetical protein n=1 Tax=Ornithobacterium rhinotracheale TaxID=28251 RepID=UPI00129C6895|nr:hypothetical protein [Ornithobacterium rhinotracheale]MRI63431.1 hypothetical protein [Ornithobacterium rhinotracheale]